MIGTLFKMFPFLCVTFLSLASVSGEDCVYEVCQCVDTDILCQYHDLTSLPTLSEQRQGLEHLHLDNNMITTIPANSLPVNLTDISLLGNPLTTIDPTAFDGSASTLNSIAFSQANFTRIPDVFASLRALTSLTVYDMNIQDWNDNAMKKIGPSLTTVFLENVGLTTWPTWFQYFTHLTELSIAGSTISYLPDNALDSVGHSLTSLTLIMSSLIEIPKAFSKLRNLQYLQVQNNEISNLTWLPQSSSLAELSMNSNNISDAKHLSESLRFLGNSLSDVKLSQNKLSAIPDLSYLTMIGSLDLSNNRIADPAAGSLPASLYHLDLRYNILPSIPSIFLNLPMVKDLMLSSNSITEIRATQIPVWILEVDLDSNLIMEIKDTSFPENSSMSMLNLDNNPLSRVSSLAFKNLGRLQFLNMENTRMTRLPLSLASLNSLTYLDVSGNLDLVCTCMEKRLESWILKLSSPVLGDCGVTSVYDFFTSLSPSCP